MAFVLLVVWLAAALSVIQTWGQTTSTAAPFVSPLLGPSKPVLMFVALRQASTALDAAPDRRDFLAKLSRALVASSAESLAAARTASTATLGLIEIAEVFPVNRSVSVVTLSFTSNITAAWLVELIASPSWNGAKTIGIFATSYDDLAPAEDDDAVPLAVAVIAGIVGFALATFLTVIGVRQRSRARSRGVSFADLSKLEQELTAYHASQTASPPSLRIPQYPTDLVKGTTSQNAADSSTSFHASAGRFGLPTRTATRDLL